MNQAHFEAYFGVNQTGYWEEENYVFYRLASAKEFIEENKLSPNFHLQINAWEQQLLKVRDQRPQPRLDDKIICSWNAMVGRGLLEAYSTLDRSIFVGYSKMYCSFPRPLSPWRPRPLSFEQRRGKSSQRLLEDYAHLIAFYLDAYEQFFTLDLLEHVTGLIDYCFQHFYTDDSPFFLFSEERELVVETRELNDNVIPSSNALMAENLLRAGGHLGRTEWTTHGEKCSTPWRKISFPIHEHTVRGCVYINKDAMEVERLSLLDHRQYAGYNPLRKRLKPFNFGRQVKPLCRTAFTPTPFSSRQNPHLLVRKQAV